MATNKRRPEEIGFQPMASGSPDFLGRSPFQVGAQAPPWAQFGNAAMGGGLNPFSLGQGISLVASGRQQPGDVMTSAENEGGPFSQLGDAIAGGASKVGGALKGAVGAVGNFIGWDGMEPMERAWLLSQAIGTGADIYSAHKQGKLEDEERKKRQRSAEALRPYITSMMDSFGS